MKFTKIHWIGTVFAVVTIALDFIFFLNENIFLFLLGIAVSVFFFPFIMTILVDNNREKEKNAMFIEFTRSLAESVKIGTPIGKSIILMKKENFGSLSPHIKKLGNQIELGIPLS